MKVKKSISCIVTGFEPFYGQPFNPSKVIAQSMPDELVLPKSKIKIPVKHFVLPVVGSKCWQVLEPILEKIKSDKQACVLVMTALAGKRNNINLERFALNIRDDIRPDNENRVVRNQKLIKSAPEAYRTDAPIEAALDHLTKEGWPAEISNYIGTYICNDVYFHAMHYFETKFKKSRLPYAVAFMHLPLPESYGKLLKGKNKKEPLNAMFEVVKTVAEFNCEFIFKERRMNK